MGEINAAEALHCVARERRPQRFPSQLRCAIFMGATNTYTKLTHSRVSSDLADARPVENEQSMSHHEHLVAIGSGPKEQADRRLREHIPKILGCEGITLNSDGESILPAVVRDGLALMSIGFLVVDCPPGTGDEPLTVAQSAAADVRRCLSFCQKAGLAIAGERYLALAQRLDRQEESWHQAESEGVASPGAPG